MGCLAGDALVGIISLYAISGAVAGPWGFAAGFVIGVAAGIATHAACGHVANDWLDEQNKRCHAHYGTCWMLACIAKLYQLGWSIAEIFDYRDRVYHCVYMGGIPVMCALNEAPGVCRT